ncbi:hypothetical protein Q7P37_008209 [Cladosporium fusiforme]
MVKAWESVRVDICRYYGEGKSLSQVKLILSRERGFNASMRSYRSKLSEWKAKRADFDCHDDHATLPIAEKQRCPSMSSHVNAIDVFGRSSTHDTPFTAQDPSPFDDFSGGSGEDMSVDALFHTVNSGEEQPLVSLDERFSRIIQRMQESPMGCSSDSILAVTDFLSEGSTLLHYVAARGYMDSVMMEVLGFCARRCITLENLDDDFSTALHVALVNSRVENVRKLLAAGAHLPEQNHLGESPLHVAIMTTDSPPLVGLLLWYNSQARDSSDGQGVNAPVASPSENAGRVPLDLAVDRVLRDMSPSGKRECTQATSGILLKVLQSTPIMEDTRYLRQHARDNYTLFGRAIKVIGKHNLAKRLVATMMEILRAEIEGKHPAFYGRLYQQQMWRPGGLASSMRA